MPSKIQIITNEHQEELKEHGTYEFPVLVSDEALSRFYTSSFQWHWHTEIELTLITEGTMVYQINDQIFYPRAGQALFGNSNTMHTGRMENGRDCRYISITFHPRLLYGYQGSRIASRYTDPLMENAALPAVCFDLSQEWHGKRSGFWRILYALTACAMIPMKWTSRWTCSVSGSFYTFTAALTGNRHIRQAGRTRNGFVRCSPSSMKTISLISPWMIFPATSISAKVSAAGSLRVT